MLNISAKIREEKNTDVLRKKGFVPGVLYGPKIKNQSVKVDSKDFDKIYKEAGESSLISLDIDDKKYLVLIYDTSRNSLTGDMMHVDFYQPILTEEVEATVPLVFEGEAPAVGDLGGTLVKEIQEIEVKALPQDLPHEIKVNVSGLKTFEDEILVKDLNVSEKVKILREPDKTVASVLPPAQIEEELEKPIEENVEEVEDTEEKPKEEEEPPKE